MTQTLLLVDDLHKNIKVLEAMLAGTPYRVLSADSGSEGLAMIDRESIDLVLLDVMMPQMDGYEVCRRIRADPRTRALPVILVTALDSSEKVAGLEAGADDFLTKPIERAELLARVKSLLRIKSMHDDLQAKRQELAEWARTLEQRVAEGIVEVDRLSRLKRFFSPQVARLILAGDLDDPLRTHRSEIVVLCVDLRGYTAFSEAADPEDVMAMLREYHGVMGRLINRYEGTVERFAGDMIMVFFNDPIPVPAPADCAVRMALDMQFEFANLAAAWSRRGYSLDIGIGIAQGYATIGAIGFEGRTDYGAIGPVCSLASRLCDCAKGGQSLVTQRVLGSVSVPIESEALGEIPMKGFQRLVPTFNVVRLANKK